MRNLDAAKPDVVGLERPTSSDPWTGTNVSTKDFRGAGLFVQVDVPTTWEPRRLCGTPCPAPLSRIQPLLAVKRAATDVALHWSPNLLAIGGYAVYRVADKTLIASVRSSPDYITVMEIEPTFPVVDAGAVPAPAGTSAFYQIVGRCADGSLGEL